MKLVRTLSTGLGTLALAVSLALPGPVVARDLVIALSPIQAPDSATAKVKSTLHFLLGLEPGDTATVMDGYHVTTLGTFAVPEDARYQSPKARLAKNRAVAGAMMRSAKQAKVSEATLPLPNAIMLPKLLSRIAEDHTGDGPLDVVIQGSPFYADPREPGFAMVDGRFPSDGHLAHGRDKTPLGVDTPDKYARLRVHLVYDAASPMEGSRHEEMIERWWRLNIEAQGGELVSFSNDLSSVFRRVLNGARAPRHDDERQPGDKLEMIRLRPVRIRESIHERALSTTPLPEAALSQARNVEVGLSWVGCHPCDLDLYVRAHAGAQALYFNHDESPEGVFFKDYRNSPQGTGAYETVALNGPVDLRKLQIAVNFYHGQAPQGVRGELRIAVDGATYAKAFVVEATSGNKGKGTKRALATGHSDSPQTVLLDPLRVVALK